jgi:hypothetical protein
VARAISSPGADAIGYAGQYLMLGVRRIDRAIGDEPALEGESLDVILARMTYE